MDTFDLVNVSRNESYELAVNKIKNYFMISYLGLWDKSSHLEYYLDDVRSALEKVTRGFNLIIDLRQYRGSTSEYARLHVDAQNLAIGAGLNKTAVIIQNNPMLKVTVEYILKQSEIEATYFSNFSAAEHWLEL